jgi:hypothetical protein
MIFLLLIFGKDDALSVIFEALKKETHDVGKPTLYFNPLTRFLPNPFLCPGENI